MPQRRPSRRVLIGVLGSVLLHAALSGWLVSRPPRQVPKVHVASAPIELEMFAVEAPAPVPAVASSPGAASSAQRVRPVPAVRAPEAPAPTATPSFDGPVAEKKVDLLPSPGSLVVPRDVEPARGHTVHNDPSELPDAEAVAAADVERVRARVQGFAEGELAFARVDKGLVPPYFASMRRELNDWAQTPPEVLRGTSSKELVREWAGQLWSSLQPGMQAYGATGSPYAAPEGWRGDSPGQMQSLAMTGDQMAHQGLQTNFAAARLREFGEGRLGTELLAIVELRQSALGTLDQTLMLRASGVKTYDDWVLLTAGNALEHLDAAVPDAGVGVHADGMRTVWAFRGKVSYKRNVKHTRLLEDSWYLLLTLPAAVTGNFDEVSGEMSYVDLRYPHYECNVKLLQIY